MEVFAEYYRTLLDGDEIPTFEGTPGFSGETRVDTWNQVKRWGSVEVASDFTLGMKNPEVFLHFLEEFQRFGVKCVVSVRHPLSIINSWVTRAHKLQAEGEPIEGSLADGASVVFKSSLPDIVDRRIDLHNYLVGRIVANLGAPSVSVIRYEDWFLDEGMLARVADFLGIPHRGYLKPNLIPPERPTLPAEEQARILEHCRIAGELGYEVSEGRLTGSEVRLD